jgi:hypothetical protein
MFLMAFVLIRDWGVADLLSSREYALPFRTAQELAWWMLLLTLAHLVSTSHYKTFSRFARHHSNAFNRVNSFSGVQLCTNRLRSRFLIASHVLDARPYELLQVRAQQGWYAPSVSRTSVLQKCGLD